MDLFDVLPRKLRESLDRSSDLTSIKQDLKVAYRLCTIFHLQLKYFGGRVSKIDNLDAHVVIYCKANENCVFPWEPHKQFRWPTIFDLNSLKKLDNLLKGELNAKLLEAFFRENEGLAARELRGLVEPERKS